MAILSAYAFPGNVRELMSIVQSTLNLSQGQRLLARHLPAKIRRDGQYRSGSESETPGRILPLAEVEKAHLLEAYRRSNGNKTRTAELLEVSLSTLRRKLESYGEA